MNVAWFQSKTDFSSKTTNGDWVRYFCQSTFIRPCLNFEPVSHKRVTNTFELHHTYIIRRGGVNCRNNRDRRLKVRIPPIFGWSKVFWKLVAQPQIEQKETFLINKRHKRITKDSTSNLENVQDLKGIWNIKNTNWVWMSTPPSKTRIESSWSNLNISKLGSRRCVNWTCTRQIKFYPDVKSFQLCTLYPFLPT